MTCRDVCQGISIVLMPPLAVSLEKGPCTRPMIVNLILTIFFFIPGIIHAALVVSGGIATDYENVRDKKKRKKLEKEQAERERAEAERNVQPETAEIPSNKGWWPHPDRHRIWRDEMDEQKIQLESRLDFDYIKSNFLSYMKGLKESKKFSMEELETFSEKVFDIVKSNIQINGEDYDEFSGTAEMEPVDESLEAKLQEIQAETDNLLVEVTRYRKKYPQIAAKNYSLNIEKCLNNIDHQLASLPQPEASKLKDELPDGLMIDYAFKVEKLSLLKKSIPEVVAKLERARQVLTEEGARVMKAQPEPITVDENMTENLSNLINSQRRVERQLDLANKMFLQF